MKLKISFPASLASSHTCTTFHKLTCSTLLLICSILTVLLSITSPRQGNTFAGSTSTIKPLWWACLSACCEWVELKNSQGESTEEEHREGKEKETGNVWGNGRKGNQRIENWNGAVNERRNREGWKDGERRENRSMKQFDNLVILLLKIDLSGRSCN